MSELGYWFTSMYAIEMQLNAAVVSEMKRAQRGFHK